MPRVPPLRDGGGPLPRRAVQVAVALFLATYLYFRLWALRDLLPGPYDPTSLTLLVRVADFLAGGAFFFAVADAICGSPAKGLSDEETPAKMAVKETKKLGALIPAPTFTGGIALAKQLISRRKHGEG